MIWIIRHNPSGAYLCSKELTVMNRQFARSFNSLKQARIYLNGSAFNKKHCSIIECSEEVKGSVMTEKELGEKILEERIRSI